MKDVLDHRLALTLVVSILLHGTLLYLLRLDKGPLRTASANTVVDVRLVPAAVSTPPDTRPTSDIPPLRPSPLNERTPRPAPASLSAKTPQPETTPPKPTRKPTRPIRLPSPQPRAIRTPAPPAASPLDHTGKPNRQTASLPATTAHSSPKKATSQMATARTRYLADLATAIKQNRHYPRLSRKRREEGRVLIGFHIASDGHFEQVRVLESSGQPRLDRATLETVRRTSPFRPPPDAMNEADREIRLPVVFRLQ